MEETKNTKIQIQKESYIKVTRVKEKIKNPTMYLHITQFLHRVICSCSMPTVLYCR